MYEARQNKEKVSRTIDVTGRTLQRGKIKNKKDTPQPSIIPKGARGNLQKENGTGLERPSSWVLSNTNGGITGAYHHIINFDTGLKTWFDDMVASYNGVSASNIPMREQRNHIKGKIRTVFRNLGVNVTNESISNSQPNYSWRHGNLFLGVRPEYRDDNPGRNHEFNRMMPSEQRLQQQFIQNRVLYNDMERIRGKTNQALQTPNEGELIDAISLTTQVPDSMITTNNTDIDNKHWEIKPGSEWGAIGKNYKLKT